MRLFTSFLTLLATLAALPAMAQDTLESIGKPVDRLLGFQPPVTELMHDIISLDNMLHSISAAICSIIGCREASVPSSTYGNCSGVGRRTG